MSLKGNAVEMYEIEGKMNLLEVIHIKDDAEGGGTTDDTSYVDVFPLTELEFTETDIIPGWISGQIYNGKTTDVNGNLIEGDVVIDESKKYRLTIDGNPFDVTMVGDGEGNYLCGNLGIMEDSDSGEDYICQVTFDSNFIVILRNYDTGMHTIKLEVFSAASTESDLDVFWDEYQDNGNRVDYSTAFGGIGWNENTFKPRHDIKPTNAYMLFNASRINGDLVEILENCGVVLDTSKATNTQYMFSGSLFTHIGTVDVTSSTNSTQMDALCRGCVNLVRFDKLVIDEKTKFASNSFHGCSALEYIGFEGAIANSLSLASSPSLNAECVQGIIDHLATVTTAQTLTLHASVVLSDEQKTAIQNKGWTLVQ